MASAPASTPEPPYWAVVFTSARTEDDPEGYAEAARRMLDLAAAQPGFLGAESVRGENGVGITVSYWDSPEAIAAWRAHPEHRAVQRAGAERWYARYAIRVCCVERASTGGAEAR
jgi:heme-degrading monooxygenase HmoA